MKKILLILLFLPFSLISQEFLEFETQGFIFRYEEGIKDIKAVITPSINFDKALESSLKIKNNEQIREIIVFKNFENYSEYLTKIGVDIKKEYIYIRYSDNQSRVVIYLNDGVNEIDLKYNIALQYMNTFAPYAPYWLKAGIATYFEESESKRWINSIRASRSRENVITTVIGSTDDNIKPYLAWIVIDYLLKSDNKAHNRLFWDSLSFLKYNPEDKNGTNYINNLYKSANLDSVISEYINDIKTFEDYMSMGIELYNSKKYSESIDMFTIAQNIEPEMYSPEYYLGLNYSNLGEFEKAYSHFTVSLDKGAPNDVVYYSIGINFYMNKEYKQAINYLTRIEGPEYTKLAKEVLNEISKY